MYTEALAAEMDPGWNIKVSLTTSQGQRIRIVDLFMTTQLTTVSLGGFETSITSNASYPALHPAYVADTVPGAKHVRKVRNGSYPDPLVLMSSYPQVNVAGNLPGDPKKGAKVIIDTLGKPNPPPFLLFGKDAVGAWKARFAALEARVRDCEAMGLQTEKDAN